MVIFHVIKTVDHVSFLDPQKSRSSYLLPLKIWVGCQQITSLKNSPSSFFCVNDFDIVILGETHLCSKINENELNIEGYSFKHCDHLNDTSRGGIGIYYKSFLPCIFKPELTKLNETLVVQVKVGTRKCVFTCIYRNPSSENNSNDKVDEFANELNNTLNNIKGKIPILTLSLVTSMQRTLYGGVIQLITLVKLFETLQAFMVSMRL